MKDLKVTRIEKRFAGYGHNEVTVTVSGNLINNYGETESVQDYELKCTTSNTLATDAYFDEYYDEDLENEDAHYESRYEAAESLVDEIFRKRQIESSYEITGLLSVEDVKELRNSIKEELDEIF